MAQERAVQDEFIEAWNISLSENKASENKAAPPSETVADQNEIEDVLF
jgi:hypothetical protein